MESPLRKLLNRHNLPRHTATPPARLTDRDWTDTQPSWKANAGGTQRSSLLRCREFQPSILRGQIYKRRVNYLHLFGSQGEQIPEVSLNNRYFVAFGFEANRRKIYKSFSCGRVVLNQPIRSAESYTLYRQGVTPLCVDSISAPVLFEAW